ncbi:hypothetical protein D9M71_775400 [compost metagenome]
MASSTPRAFSPLMIRVPSSMPSGRSCAVRTVTAERFSNEASSVIVPLSDRTHLAPIWSFM